jgi:hypothetical protein
MSHGSIQIQSGETSDWVALAALIVSVATTIFTIWWSFWSARRSYIEGYWFREVTAPSCIEPALAIRGKWCKRIELLGNTLLTPVGTRSLIAELQTDVDEAIRAVWICKLFEGDLYEALVNRLEEIGDVVAYKLNGPVRAGHIVPSSVAASASDAISSRVLWVVQRAAAANGADLKIGKVTPTIA